MGSELTMSSSNSGWWVTRVDRLDPKPDADEIPPQGDPPPAALYHGLLLRGRIINRWKRRLPKKKGGEWEKVSYEIMTESGPVRFFQLQDVIPGEEPPYLVIGTMGEWPVYVHLYTRHDGVVQYQLTMVGNRFEGQF